MRFNSTFLHLHSRSFPKRQHVVDLQACTNRCSPSKQMSHTGRTSNLQCSYSQTHTAGTIHTPFRRNASRYAKSLSYQRDVQSDYRAIIDITGTHSNCTGSITQKRLTYNRKHEQVPSSKNLERGSKHGMRRRYSWQHSYTHTPVPQCTKGLSDGRDNGARIGIEYRMQLRSTLDKHNIRTLNNSNNIDSLCSNPANNFSVGRTLSRRYSQITGRSLGVNHPALRGATCGPIPCVRMTQYTGYGIPVRHNSTGAPKMVGACSIINRRQHQEDRITVAHLSPQLSFFGCYDGHNGSFAADFAHKHVHKHLIKLVDSGIEVEVAIREAIAKVDEQLNSISHMQSGSTACICVIQNNKLIVANIGDSAAFLCREAKAVDLTYAHRPSIQKEKDRIEACGGRVSSELDGVARVNERLAMSRALGDFTFRQFGVIAEPDVGVFELSGKDCFLVLATDGVFDVLNSAQACAVVNSCEDPEEGAQELVSLAAQLGSHDNASAVVVRLEGWGLFENPDDVRLRAQAYSYNRGGRFKSLSHI